MQHGKYGVMTTELLQAATIAGFLLFYDSVLLLLLLLLFLFFLFLLIVFTVLLTLKKEYNLPNSRQ